MSKYDKLHGLDAEALKDKLDLVGPFDAIVVSNKDPGGIGYISVKIPELYGNEEIKDVAPLFPTFEFSVPKKGMMTRIFFQKTSRDLPMWFGQWYPNKNKPEEVDGDPKTHIIKNVTDENLKSLFSMIYKEDKSFVINDNKHGSRIEIDIATGKIYIESDKGPNGQGMAPVYINGREADSRGAARQFDKTVHIDPLLGIPVEGIIMEGSKRVQIDGKK